ncbi:MAG: hypothetical protein KJP25_01435 [Gammaproteobacteria bacterium]|nr:hypothetical protein [Gammaproteobacteria bacterium]MBT8152140.1 hypothetical protein [Gammaproteobacteria bacterium]RZV53267.1 MAG: hypothetical protein EX270_08910 [Pseudomonadales bacterium]
MESTPEKTGNPDTQSPPTSNLGMVKFIAIFLALLWGFYFLYINYFIGTDLFKHYLNLSVSVISKFLEATGEQVHLLNLTNGLRGEIASHDGAYVRFTEGTDGLMVMAVLVSAIIAWPGLIARKLIAVLLAVIFIYFANLLRVCAMFKVDVYFAPHFDLVNEWIFPIALIIAASAYFFGWVKISGRHPLE